MRMVRMLLTIHDIASLIGCTPKAVRHCVARGQPPGVTRIGGSVYLRRAEVLPFLAEGRGPSPERSRLMAACGRYPLDAARMRKLRERAMLRGRRKRTENGFGPRSLFYGALWPHFDSPRNALRLKRAFLGSACEQWLNGECMQAITAARPNIWARSGRRKRDLILFRSDEAGRADDPSLVVETKVLYSRESHEAQASKLATLARQMREAERQYPRATVVGLLVRFEYSWRKRDGSRRSRVLRRRPYVARRNMFELGLGNAFGHRSGASIPALKDSRRIEFGPYVYDVSVVLEMVRLHAAALLRHPRERRRPPGARNGFTSLG